MFKLPFSSIKAAILLLLTFVPLYVSAQLRNSSGLKHFPQKSYSISDKSDNYTLCFDDIVQTFNSSKSVAIGKILLDPVKYKQIRSGHLEESALYDILDKSDELPPQQLQLLTKLLTEIEGYVYKYTEKVHHDKTRLKNLKRFSISVVNDDIDLVQPDEDTHQMLFPLKIIKDIYKYSLMGIYNEDEPAGDETQSFNIKEFIEDSDLEYCGYYFRWMDWNQKFIPPCIPVLRKAGFLNIINNKKLLRDNLTSREKETLQRIRERVTQKDFQMEPILEPVEEDSPGIFAALIPLIAWKNAPAELVSFKEKVMSDKLDELDDRDETMANYFHNQSTYYIVSNYLTLEMYKYLTFLIAHEAYHAWFAPGDIKAIREVEADQFATWIYLELFSDTKFEAANNFTQQTLGKLQTSLGMQPPPAEDDQGSGGVNMFSAFLGRPVNEIFKEVYTKMGFYEKGSDALHLSGKKRIQNMDKITTADSKKILIALNKHFEQKFNLTK